MRTAIACILFGFVDAKKSIDFGVVRSSSGDVASGVSVSPIPGVTLLSQNSETMTSIQAIYYVGSVSLGSANETFSVILDTGSNLLWVPDASCTDTCASKQKFTGDSVSLSESFNITYGSGSAMVSVATTSVQFAEGALSSFKVGLASVVDMPGYDTGSFDGLLGLAWPGLNSDTTIPSIVPELFANSQIAESLFAIYLSPDGSNGELSVGEIDSTKYVGEIAWMDLVEQLWWTVSYVGYVIGSDSELSPLNNVNAILDSGTTMIVGPGDAVDALVNSLVNAAPSINFSYDSTNALYAVNCSDVAALPDVAIQLIGADNTPYLFTMPGYTYVVPSLSSDPTVCPLAFQGDPNSDMWILGDPVLRAYYTIYDYGNSRVGLASLGDSGGVGRISAGLDPNATVTTTEAPLTDSGNSTMEPLVTSTTMEPIPSTDPVNASTSTRSAATFGMAQNAAYLIVLFSVMFAGYY